MTRFEMELNGMLGDFWKKHAEKELDDIRNDYALGRINIVDGVAYNCIGRVVMDDMAEKIERAGLPIDRKATAEAYSAKTRQDIENYRNAQAGRAYSEEEVSEMRATFGQGTVVIDVLTGREFQL